MRPTFCIGNETRAAFVAAMPTQPFGQPRAPLSPSAGHGFSRSSQPFKASFSARLTNTGQINSWKPMKEATRSGAPLPVHMRPDWNGRAPVWEQRIPQWDQQKGMPASRYKAPPPSRSSTFNPYESTVSMQSPAKSQVVTRDWSLLFSPGRVDSLVRRPWPEYEPESSAAVGRRWTGCNLGRLYEHVAPSSSPVDSYSPSPSQSDLMGASFNTLSMSPSQQSMPMSPVAYRDF